MRKEGFSPLSDRIKCETDFSCKCQVTHKKNSELYINNSGFYTARQLGKVCITVTSSEVNLTSSAECEYQKKVKLNIGVGYLGANKTKHRTKTSQSHIPAAHTTLCQS